MELSEETADNVTIVVVVGRLDAAASRQLGERLASLIRSGRPHLLLDASRLDYMGSMGLRALLAADRLAADAKGRLVLCGLTAPVRRIVEMGGFGDQLDTCASREEAIAKFSGG